jgi:hypothetical protein
MTIKLSCAVCAMMERCWKAKMPSIDHTVSRREVRLHPSLAGEASKGAAEHGDTGRHLVRERYSTRIHITLQSVHQISSGSRTECTRTVLVLQPLSYKAVSQGRDDSTQEHNDLIPDMSSPDADSSINSEHGSHCMSLPVATHHPGPSLKLNAYSGV